MSTIALACRACGNEFTPTRDDVMRGPAHYRTCPTCQLANGSGHAPAPTRCEGCGRVLRAGAQTLCYSCLTGGTGL